MPALVFDNRTLYYGSLADPPLLSSILQSGRWRCVFCDIQSERMASDPRQDPPPILDGSAVFMAPEFADQLGLPAADTSVLEMLIALNRLSRGARRGDR
jgi:hypothetical protein